MMERRKALTTRRRGGVPGPGPARSAVPRWLRFGPGLALALLASVLLWPRLRDGMQSARPRIERTQLAAVPAPPAAPELGWLLEQRATLRLTAVQVERLHRLKARWDGETQPLRDGLDEAAREFSRGMVPGNRPEGTRPQSLQELQEQAAPLSNLSRRLAEARRSYWREAARLLSGVQRQRAEEAWTRRLAGGH